MFGMVKYVLYKRRGQTRIFIPLQNISHEVSAVLQILRNYSKIDRLKAATYCLFRYGRLWIAAACLSVYCTELCPLQQSFLLRILYWASSPDLSWFRPPKGLSCPRIPSLNSGLPSWAAHQESRCHFRRQLTEIELSAHPSASPGVSSTSRSISREHFKDCCHNIRGN